MSGSKIILGQQIFVDPKTMSPKNLVPRYFRSKICGPYKIWVPKMDVQKNCVQQIWSEG